MRTFAVVNRKGGVGKSTLSLGLADALSRRGRTGLLDTDPETSAVEGLPDDTAVDAIPLEHGQLVGVVADPAIAGTYDYLVIDTPPNSAEAIDAASSVADLVLIPLGATRVEIGRLARTVERLNGTPWLVVPSRVRLSTEAGRTMQAELRAQGVPVTRSLIPMREAIALSYGETPPPLYFKTLADELLEQMEGTP